MPSREQLFNSLLASPTIKKAIQDEAKAKNISQAQARQNAVKLLNEIAANYSEAMIRVAERFLTWLWNKLYNGINYLYAVPSQPYGLLTTYLCYLSSRFSTTTYSRGY